MPIENIWPGKKANGLLRAMYNIAVHRLNPGHAPKRDRDVMEADIDGRSVWARLYGSANQGYHWIRLTPSVAETLRGAATQHPGDPVIFLAGDTGLAPALQRIDLTNYYAPWNLDHDELAHVKEFASAPETSPIQTPDEGNPPEEDEETDAASTADRAVGVNKIYFGPPGTGKTWSVNAFCDDRRNPQKFPTTFHPEYTYYDFIGSYKPVMAFSGSGAPYQIATGEKLPDGVPAVVYRFVPGVFTGALIRALGHPQDDVFLIIDEINRGNCAAIFGDVFQLLDRVAEPGPEQGRSRYAIQVDPIILEYCCSKVNSQIADEIRGRGVRIPKNMHLLATMNTSDQSLFPMDSAFKRRWEWEYVPINYEQEEIKTRHVIIRAGAEQQTVPWVKFLRHVNQLISEVTGSDDKQIGVFFVPLDADVSAARFLNKVLFYLWSDVFRHNPEGLFAHGIQSYDDLARRFVQRDEHRLSLIEAGLGLAEDYRQHGLLRFRETHVHDGPAGRIDWVRTLQRTIPTPTGQSVFYGQPCRRSLTQHDNHPLTQLHAATVRDVFDRLFGQWVELQFDPPSRHLIQQELSSVLSRYRGRLYQERQISIVQMMGAYWGQMPTGARSIDTTWEYTEKFEVIWEEMCRSVIGGVRADNGALPRGRYIGAAGQDFGAGLRLVPDFVLQADGQVIVFDAKFYTSDALPDTYSILKQLAYGFFLSREWSDGGVAPDRVIHAFLLPKFHNEHLATLRGRHMISPRGRSASMAAPIYLLDLDYEAVVGAYLRYGTIGVNALLRMATLGVPSP